MQIEITESIGTLESGRKAVVRKWKDDPANFDAACHAAGHYARRNSCRMAVVPGNSYGRACFHLLAENECIRKAVPGCPKDGFVRVGLVDADGNVHMANAT